MRIAVASQNWITITKHPGKTRRFLVFATDSRGLPAQVGRIELEAEQTIHETRGNEVHPLDKVDVVIAGSTGEGFVHRMGRKGIRVVISEQEKDPKAAVTAFLDGRLKPTEASTENGQPHHGHHHHAH